MALLTSHWILDVALVFLSALVAAYFYVTRNFNHWAKKGVLGTQPVPFVGNFLDCCLFRMSTGEYLASLYARAKGQPYVGFYLFDKPAIVLRDPEIIKTVLVKDFYYFPNRYATATEADQIGNNNLFMIKNPDWKDLRRKLTPIFSSGKIKEMFSLVNAVGDDLVAHLESLKLEGDGQVVELKEISAKYTTDVIGTCAFGLQVNSLNNPEAEFRKNGKKIFEVSYKRGFELMSIFFIPGIVKPLGFNTFAAECSAFLRKAFWDTFNLRVDSGVRRNDLIDLLIDLKASQKEHDDPNAFKFEGDNLVAQCAIFFAAGFETSSTLMSFTLHELSLRPDIQEKLRHEITTALEENGGQLSYDTVQQLPYLDQVVHETLRKYPSLPFLDREAARDYTIEKTGLVIAKGTPVYIPLLGLHYDPEYFPDPEKYDPERFNEENKRNRPPYVYMPFGEGPHNCIGLTKTGQQSHKMYCIGLRFGLMQAKIGVCRIIPNYELIPCAKTLNPMRFESKGLVIASDGGLYHRVRKIKETVV